jgi:hypothetical protein
MAAPEDFDEKVRALRQTARPPQDVLIAHPAEPARAAPEARYDFLRLGEEIAKSLIETAEAQVTQAENMLKHTQAFAENVRAQIAEKQRELPEMTERLAFDTHNRFHSNFTPTEGI